MAALGDKIGSTILAQAASVPTIPWSGSGISMDYGTCDGVIPQDIYDAVGCTTLSSKLSSALGKLKSIGDVAIWW